LYSSGLVAGKSSQKKAIEPARNATDAAPMTEKQKATLEVRHNNFTNLNVYFVLSKENRTYIYVYKYTPFVRGDEKTGKPIILQKT